jgi:hypothetical protein
VFTEEKTQHQKIKRIIVHHVPMLEDKIGVINADTADGAKLQQISDSYNTGGYILVIANKKAEVGVNLQKGTTAIHHLTLPWTPASIQQRNGRGIRQGNPAEHINVYYYMGRGSFDGFRLDLLQKKSNWMRDLFDAKEATADNANAFNGDDFIDMLEANPEEAKKRRLERLAAKQAERQAREDKVWINTLAQLSNVTYQLNNLDAAKERERVRINDKIDDAQRTIGNLEYRKDSIPLEDVDKHQSKLESANQTLASWQQKASNLDADFAGTKANLEAKVQKTAGLLKGRAKKNELPFDPALIDKPDQALVTFGGRIIAVGDCYEAKEDIRNSNGSIREGTIIKITEVDIPKRLFKCETITGWENLKHADGKYGWHSSDLFTNKVLVQVSYSEKELALKKILTEEMTYQSLIDGTIDLDTFREHLSQIRFSQYGDCVMEIGGEIVFDSCETDEKKMSIVYPEIDNEDFRKRVAEKYLEMYRDSSALGLITRSTKQLMGLIFGSAWHTTILSYGKTATESEVRAVLADAWQAIIKEAQDVLKLDVTNLMVLRDLTGPGNRSKMQSKATALGDNVDEIRSIAASFFNTLQEDINAKIRDRQDEADRLDKIKAMEDAKKDPNYKEIPADVDAAFKKLGLTVKYNLTRITLPGFKGRKGEVIEPFGRLFLQDSRGKNGSLFRVKEILKTRYQAKFFSDAGDGFMGAWWHVPGNTDVAELYKLLS